METREIINKYGDKITYKVSDEIKEKIIDRIIEYCQETGCYSGESLHQCDDGIMEAPSVMSDIIDDIIEMNHN